MPRMQILTPVEFNAFETPPAFSNVERQRFFDLSPRFVHLLSPLRTPTNQICFVLALGYFRTTKRFFARQSREADAEYVTQQPTKSARIRTTFTLMIATLDLTHDGIRYYANAVLKSQVFQTSRRTDEDRHLHLVCFIAHQFYRLQDTLIDILLTTVQTALNACTRHHKEQYYAARLKPLSSIRHYPIPKRCRVFRAY